MMTNPEDKRDQAGSGESREAESSEVEALRQEIEALKKKADENWDLFLRSRADLDNYRKRTERDMAMMIRMGKKDMLLRLLDVADGFERALAAQNAGAEALRSGFEILSRQFAAVLEAEGLKPIPSVGERFDPAVHEAVANWVSPDVVEDTVTDEIRKGYTYQGDVLRAARVRVAQPPGDGGSSTGAGCSGSQQDGRQSGDQS